MKPWTKTRHHFTSLKMRSNENFRLFSAVLVFQRISKQGAQGKRCSFWKLTFESIPFSSSTLPCHTVIDISHVCCIFWCLAVKNQNKKSKYKVMTSEKEKKTTDKPVLCKRVSMAWRVTYFYSVGVWLLKTACLMGFVLFQGIFCC